MYNTHSLLLPVTSKINQSVVSKCFDNLDTVTQLIKLHHAVVIAEFWCPVTAVIFLTHFVFVSVSSWMWTEAHKYMKNSKSGTKSLPKLKV